MTDLKFVAVRRGGSSPLRSTIKRRIMTQEEFEGFMTMAECSPSTRAAVRNAVMLCIEHPCYAQIWYENRYGNEKE